MLITHYGPFISGGKQIAIKTCWNGPHKLANMHHTLLLLLQYKAHHNTLPLPSTAQSYE